MAKIKLYQISIKTILFKLHQILKSSYSPTEEKNSFLSLFSLRNAILAALSLLNGMMSTSFIFIYFMSVLIASVLSTSLQSSSLSRKISLDTLLLFFDRFN